MKKAAALLLALALCAGAAGALAAGEDYGPLAVSGANDMYPGGYTTEISFEAAVLETGPVRFAEPAAYGDTAGDGAVEREVSILTVRPGSAFTVNAWQNGELRSPGFSQLTSYPYYEDEDGAYRRGSPSAASLSSGAAGDWFRSWGASVPAMLWFKLGGTEYCVFLGESAVRRSAQRVTVDGAAVTPDVYNIDGYNYFKLRDLAMLLKDTPARFSVDYDRAAQTIFAVTGADYAPDGSELKDGGDRSGDCRPSAQPLLIDGKPASLTAYNIGGYNYFKLAELGEALGFGVDYDAETNTAAITTK